MTKKNSEKTLARAVQQAVVDRRGGTAPSYVTCLRMVQAELAWWNNVPMEQRADTWKDVVVANVAKHLD